MLSKFNFSETSGLYRTFKTGRPEFTGLFDKDVVGKSSCNRAYDLRSMSYARSKFLVFA